MKKIILSLITLTLFTLSSCVSDQENINDDSKKSYMATPEALLSNAEKALSDQITTPSVNYNPLRYYTQYWAATLYTAESRYNLTSRTIPDNCWDVLYWKVLGNLETAGEIIKTETKPVEMEETEWLTAQKNKVAILEILKVYTFQILVDIFGDVPYSESLQNPNIVLPKYDDDAIIYPQLIERLNKALSDLDESANSFESGDLIYNGDISKWKLFGNSLKLKLGTNLSDKDPALAKTTIEDAYEAGVILENNDNALLIYASFAPNYNPIFDNLIVSQRNDFVPANTLVDRMNALEDFRRPIYFTPMEDGTYVGGIQGGYNGDPYQISYSHVGDVLKKPSAPGVLIEAAEVNFYLAEAAARGLNVGQSVETFYNNAITASCKYWGVKDADIAAYLANPDVAYATAASTKVEGTENGTTGTNTWQEKIGYQAWIALYNRTIESWNSYRRLDFPILKAPPRAIPNADKKVPVRWTYPNDEHTVNGKNWTDASTAIGGDLLTTKIFWDIH